MDNNQLSTPLLSDAKSLERVPSLPIIVYQEPKSSLAKTSSVYVGDNATQHDQMSGILDNISSVFNNHLPSEATMLHYISELANLSDKTHLLASTFNGVALYIDMNTKKFEEKKICDKLYHVVVLKGEQKAIFSGITAIYEVSLPSLSLVKEKTHDFKTNISKIMFSPDQKSLYVLVLRQGIAKVNLENFEIREAFIEGDFVRMAISRNEELATFSRDEKFTLKNLQTSNEKEVKISLNGNSLDMQFSNSQSKVLVIGVETVAIINVNPFEVYRVFTISVGLRAAVIAKDDNTLIVGDNNGKLQFWDIKNEVKLSEYQVHNKQVLYLGLSTDGQLIYSSSLDLRFCILIFPQFAKELSTRVKGYIWSPFRAELILKIKEGMYRKWDLVTNKTVDLVVDCSQIDEYDWFDDENLLIINQQAIIKYNYITKKYIEIPLKDDDKDTIYSYEFSPDRAYLATGGSSQKVSLWDLKTMKKVKEFKGCDNYIRKIIFLPNSNVIAAGSSVGSAYFWNMDTRDFEISPIKGEKGTAVESINSFRNEENVAIFYADDPILVFFNWRSKTLLATLNAGGTIKSVIVVKDEKSIIVATEEGKIFFWDLLTFTILFSNDLKQGIWSFRLTADEKYFTIGVNTTTETIKKELKEEPKEDKKDEAELIVKSESDNLFIKKNPLATEVVVAAGTGSELDYMKYVMDLKNSKGKQHKPEYDKWIIMPYRINTLHLYAYFNQQNQLKLAIDAGGSLFNTNFSESALSFAVKKQFSGCVSAIVSSLGKTLKGNPNALNFISEECINGLNRLGYPSLTKFYKLIYSPYTGKFVKFVSESTPTPIYYNSKVIIPLKSNFSLPDENKKEGKSVKCMVTSLPLPLAIGSKISTEFLHSLEICPNSEIFTTKLIQDILDHKWDELKWAMYWQAIIYTIYMILLSLYILYWIGQSLPLIIVFIFSLLLTSYEVFQFVTSPSEYVEDLWNYVDGIRTILTVIYSTTVWLEEKHTDLCYDILVCLVMVSWARGISYFRIFKNTRYMVNLITQVIKDITSFLILLFYSTLAFAFIFLVMDRNDPKLIDYIKFSYRLDLGDFDASSLSSTQWVCFFLATMINMIIMLNLLISIMGDTFGRVQENAEVADRKELLGMIIEIETLMFWKKQITEKYYFQALIGEESEEAEQNINTRLAEVKKNQKLFHLQNQKKLENVDKRFENLEKKFENQEKKFENVEKRFENVEKRFENLEKRFENQEEIIKKIWNKLEGDVKEGEVKEGDKKEGDKKEGDVKEGDKKEEDMKAVDKIDGDLNKENEKEGDVKEGDVKEGDKEEGDKEEEEEEEDKQEEVEDEEHSASDEKSGEVSGEEEN